MSRRTPPVSKIEEKSTNNELPTNTTTSANSSNNGLNSSPSSSSSISSNPASPRVTLRLPQVAKTPEKFSRNMEKNCGDGDDPYEFKCTKEERPSNEEGSNERTSGPNSSGEESKEAVTTEEKGEKRGAHEIDEQEDQKRKKKKDDSKEFSKQSSRMSSRPGDKGSKSNRISANSSGKQMMGSSSGTHDSPSNTSNQDATDSDTELKTESGPGAPKVPPLKIVLSAVGSSEQEQSGANNNKSTNNRQLLYVVNTNEEKDTTVDTSEANLKSEDSSSSHQSSNNQSGGSNTLALNSSSSNTAETSSDTTKSSPTVSTSGQDNGSFANNPQNTSSCESSSCSSQVDSTANSSNLNNQSCSVSGSNMSNSISAGEKGGTRITRSRGGGGNSSDEPMKSDDGKHEDQSSSSTDVVHPRKRKIKIKEEFKMKDHTEMQSSTPMESQAPPITNSYEMFLKIRKQIDQKRKNLFPVTPKPPQGFKDYLLNRCSYLLAGNSKSHFQPTLPPTILCQTLKDLFTEQEKERYRLRLQHQIEKEKLVLSVEQEILRVHGRAARALANQALPFSVCTILKDEEVYNVITPEQEEKDRNARSRYNGRHFIAWLQEVDDKWEKIKEAMVLRHHNEVESLHAVQKMDWEWKLKELGDVNSGPPPETKQVPMVQVNDFDLLPAEIIS